jgi:3-oxoisoapionate kinase
MSAPHMVWYGDDFTGATDTLSVLAGAGLRTMLFMGVPDAVQTERATRALDGPLDAVGIAGVTRTLDYKVCSTFDSAPHIGNIAAAVQTLRSFVGNPWVPVFGGQPSLGRYCLFGHLFASAGLGAQVVRIDRHPTMSRHPMTPMAESDLRRHLALQGLEPVQAWHYPNFELDADQQDRLLETMVDEPASAMLMDVSSARDLTALGRQVWKAACTNPLLAVGPSSVAQALVAHWSATGNRSLEVSASSVSAGRVSAGSESELIGPARGPVLIFAGSLSPVTAQQVANARAYERVRLPVDVLLENGAPAQRAIESVAAALFTGRNTIVHTAPEQGVLADTTLASRTARASTAWIGRLLASIQSRGVRLGRLCIAGGDTSSLIMKTLPIWGLSYSGSLDAGVSLCRAHSDEPSLDSLELVLKGGQMGGVELFDRLARGS